MEQPPPLPSAPRQNWFKRNWKWFVPSGCLVVFLAIVAVIGLIVISVFSVMKQAEPYRFAMNAAKQNAELREAIGTPIKESFFLSGNTNVNGASGESSLAIPVSGPKGKATVYVEAKKEAGIWEYQKVSAEVAGTGQRIDLNTAGGPEK